MTLAQADLQRAFTAWQQGRLEEARLICEALLVGRPTSADALHLLGLIARQTGDSERAATFIRRAVELQPNNPAFHIHHGLALQDVGETSAAIDSYSRAIALKPGSAPAYFNRGNAFRELKQLEAAIADYDQATAIRPGYAEAFSNRGNALRALGKIDAAIASHEMAIAAKPDDAVLYDNLAAALLQQGQVVAAEATLRKAIALFPTNSKLYHRLAHTLLDGARPAEAEAACRRAIALQPDWRKPYSTLIFILDYTATDAAVLQTARKQWAAHFATQDLRAHPHSNARAPHRSLRIGYISADFSLHSASIVFGAMLMKFDTRQYEVYAYSNSANVDDVTRAFQSSVTRWRLIEELSDDSVCDLIREDEIDILVDLSGHSAGSRLPVFAKKPAPVQVTAWGCITGTIGLGTIDAIFADPVVVPAHEKSLYAEEVVYLPSVLSALFPMDHPDVNALPALSGESVTFGSFNRLIKISDETFKAWVRILHAVPGSRFILKTSEFAAEHHRERVSKQFSDAGIDLNRVTLLGLTYWYEHQAAYNRVDISLDPFPHSGGVTALEGLMMGVPMVTLNGPTLVGRLSASVLTTIGLTDWIAKNVDDYVELAAQKAKNLQELAELRQGLRTRFSQSILGDTSAYVAAVEREYRRLWNRWCERQGP